MNWLAWTVCGAFLAYVVLDGVRRSRAAKDLDGYYAGNRSIPWWAAGLSVMATQASAITVIGTTGQGHEGGLGFLQAYFGLPLAMILLCLFMVPLYRRQPVLTAYEYLEHRFDPATRALGSALFLFSRCLALGVVINAPAVVLSAMLELPLEWTIIGVGAITTLYTVAGGISAVVWTDVKQMIVIVGGLLLCFGMLAADVFGELGLDGALRAAGAAGKLDALELAPASTDFVPRLAGSDGAKTFWDDKYNFWSGTIGGLFLMLSYFGCDQSQVQRILTNPTANDSRRALLLSAFAKIPMQLGVLAIGVLLYVHHGLAGEPLLYKPTDELRATNSANAALYEQLQGEYAAALTRRGDAMRRLAAVDGDPESEPEVLADYRDAVRDVAAIRTRAAKAFSAERETYLEECVERARNAHGIFGLPEVVELSGALADPTRGGTKGDTNYVFPQWMLAELPPVLLGLILAAVFAAAMSSVDSVLNSLSAATVVDFVQRFAARNMQPSTALVVGRMATLAWGVIATSAAIVLISGSSIIEQVNRVGSFFYGTLLGVFTLGLFFRRARGFAGGAGILGGMASVLVVHNTLQIEFLWYNVVGLVGTLVTGVVFGVLFRRA